MAAVIDFRRMDALPERDYDLCIVGAGAAGITLAREFAGAQASVCLLESGGFEFDAETQALNQGENVGVELWDLETARLRYFGGTTNHWTGRCAPLAEIDFRQRDWVPHSGWPITLTDLEPFYRRAQAICDLGTLPYDESVWDALPTEKPAFDPNKLKTLFYQFSDSESAPEPGRRIAPTRFGAKYRREITGAANFTLILNANVTNLQTDDGGHRVIHADLRSLSGRAGRVRARRFVLACGGLGNVGLLLNSNGTEPAGLGNRYDQVGRYFMDHPSATCGRLVADNPASLADTFDRSTLGGKQLMPGFYPPPPLQQAKRILSGCAVLQWLPRPGNGVTAFKDTMKRLGAGNPGAIELEDLLSIGRDFGAVSRQLLRRLKGRGMIPPLEGFELYLRGEQAPNPGSRITLLRDTDALGMRRLRVDVRMGRLTKDSARALLQAIAEECGRLHLGRVQIHDWLLEPGDDWSGAPNLSGGHHMMGGTRMSDDAREGVVDSDCKVHGLGNLYIAGSSAFATGGYANPTLTVVALTLRLAAHLKGEMGVG